MRASAETRKLGSMTWASVTPRHSRSQQITAFGRDLARPFGLQVAGAQPLGDLGDRLGLAVLVEVGSSAPVIASASMIAGSYRRGT